VARSYDLPVLVPPPADLTRDRRIVLYGVTGSGKSTLAARIADLGGMPYVSTDDLMWRPGWVQVPREEQAGLLRDTTEGPAWVIDSLWSGTRELVLPRTDLLVALDYPRRTSLTRLLRRTAQRLRTREEVCGGNHESWGQVLSRDSIVAWHARSFASKQAQIEQWCEDPSGPRVARFTDPGQTDAWLRHLERVAA
jgi:adenylate kinase family enzyme